MNQLWESHSNIETQFRDCVICTSHRWVRPFENPLLPGRRGNNLKKGEIHLVPNFCPNYISKTLLMSCTAWLAKESSENQQEAFQASFWRVSASSSLYHCNSTIIPFCFSFSYARAILHSVGLSTEIGKKCLLWNKRLPQFSSPKNCSISHAVDHLSSFSTDMSVLRPLLAQWEMVAVFFMLRLTVAACVESMLLLDRAMYLQEQGVEINDGHMHLYHKSFHPGLGSM